MPIQEIVTAISSVGFPIVACCVMFWQNNKLQSTLSDISATMQVMSDRINDLENKSN